MIIRPMEEKDVPRVSEIEHELFSDAWSESDFYETLTRPEARFIVAELDDGIVAGYCGTYKALDEAEIVNVAVSQQFQNLGIGKKIVAELIEQDRADGIINFILEVRFNNDSAKHVYEQLGFQNIGIRKNFYSNPVEDAVIMQFLVE